MVERVYFYPHAYLRDRQLDTIRRWPAAAAVNPEIADDRTGCQVSREAALRPTRPNLRSRLPLLNLKRRPPDAPTDATVYLWNGIPLTGPFITDTDNQFAFTAYNVRATRLYRPVIRRLLSAARCREIRCMSRACRDGLAREFGAEVAGKATVAYPFVTVAPRERRPSAAGECRFLFVATQFDIKGGAALLRAFRRLRAAVPGATLDLVTHLPPEFETEVRETEGIVVHRAAFSREEIASRFLRRADVLVHPTYADSFAMVVLEALGHGLPVIATDLYAIPEMVNDGDNGILITPPVALWRGIDPAPSFPDLARLREEVRTTDTRDFEDRLFEAMLAFAQDPERRRGAGAASLKRARRLQAGRW